MLTARLQIELVYAPVAEIVMEREHAHVLDEMQFAGAIKVEHGAERARISVEKELALFRIEIVAQLANLSRTFGVS